MTTFPFFRQGPKSVFWLVGLCVVVFLKRDLRAEDHASAMTVAHRIDFLLQNHWREHGIQPARPAEDATFFRRIMLDLAGRIPTLAECDEFQSDQAPNKRHRWIGRLIEGPEFSRHIADRLDLMIQGRYAGNPEFLGWLEKNLSEGQPWDGMFQEMMLGPWEQAERKPANRFLDKRAKDPDILATDTARVFFGVDISCAKCHDHPLVADWSQNHYYGMVAFFHRTTGGNGKVGEKAEGEVTFLAGDGKERTATMMFLSGRQLSEPAFAARPKQKLPVFSRRQRLVELALEDQSFFSRSIVNRLWAEFFGRGLIEPVDQMHSESVPAVPGLLDWLAADFSANGYNLKRLIQGLVSSQAYQLASRWQEASPPPDASSFAIASLRPLTRQQWAVSLLIATGKQSADQPDRDKIADLKTAIDPRSADFQSSADEALFLSNSPTVQGLFTAEDNNLAARLAKLSDTNPMIEEAVRTIFHRPPHPEERKQLSRWIDAQTGSRESLCGQLAWALVTSAEFRFNH